MALAAAVLAFIAISSLVSLAWAVWVGMLTVSAAWAGLFAGALGAAAVFAASRKVRYEGAKPGFFEWSILVFFCFFVCAIFCGFTTRMAQPFTR